MGMRHQLKGVLPWLQLVAAEERCALAETEIRQEVSAEMASLLHDMEANYKVGHHNQ